MTVREDDVLFINLPSELHQLISDHLPISDVNALVRTGRFLHLRLQHRLSRAFDEMLSNKEGCTILLHAAIATESPELAKAILVTGFIDSPISPITIKRPICSKRRSTYYDSPDYETELHQTTLLHLAAHVENIEIVTLLLAKHDQETITSLLSTEDATGLIPFLLATGGNNIDVCRYMLDLSASATNCDYQGWGPVYEAAQHGSIEIIGLLISRCHISVYELCDVLRIGCARGDSLEMDQLLIDHGADPGPVQGCSGTALHYFANPIVVDMVLEKMDSEMASSIMLGQAVAFNRYDPMMDSTPLHAHSIAHNAEMVRFWLEKGVPVDLLAKKTARMATHTPLDMVAIGGVLHKSTDEILVDEIQCALALLDAGADIKTAVESIQNGEGLEESERDSCMDRFMEYQTLWENRRAKKTSEDVVQRMSCLSVASRSV